MHRDHARPQRILMTADAIGGVWTYALDLALGVGRWGVEVVLATMGPPPSPAQLAEAERVPGLMLCVSEFKLEWMPDPWRDVERAGDWLLDLEGDVRPDLVQINGFCHASLPFRAPVVAVCHSDVLSWWEAVKGEPAPSEWDEYAQRVRAGLAGAELVLAPTAAALADAARHYGPFRASRVVRNGRSEPPLPCGWSRERGLGARVRKLGTQKPSHSATDTSRDEPHGRGGSFIFAAGRAWDAAKNLRLLAQIAPSLGWPVRIAGDFGDVAPPGVEALGRLQPEAMGEQYAQAAIFAHPARYEPFGLSVLEAALADCALVLGDIPSLRELWDGAALFVPPDDAEAWAGTLNRLASSDVERAGLAFRARERATRYTVEAMTEGYLEAYGEMAAVKAR